MPQSLLPLIPDGATPINDLVSVVRENGEWTYFLGVLPVFSHAEEDRRSFRMLCPSGNRAILGGAGAREPGSRHGWGGGFARRSPQAVAAAVVARPNCR
jgi:hypothetical protein